MNILRFFKNIFSRTSGQALPEYALIAALVGLAMVAGTMYYFESTKVNYYNGMVPLSKGENIPPPPEIKDGNLTLVGNQKPVAVIEGPLKASVGQKLVFTDASYDLDGSIKFTSWGSKTIERVFYKEGTYVIELEVIDDKGAKGRKEIEVVVGRSIPLAVIYMDKTNVVHKTDSLQVHAKNSTDPYGDKIVGATWYLTKPNGVREKMDWGLEGHKFEPNELEAGVYKFELQVTDEYQDVSEWTTSIIRFNSNPIAGITIDPLVVNLGQPVIISSTGSHDPDGDLLAEAEWTLISPNGTRTKMNWGLDRPISYNSPTMGQHRVELRVKDSHNAWSNVATGVFMVKTIPTAVITVNPDRVITHTETVNISGNGSYDVDGDTIVRAEWVRVKGSTRTTLDWGINGGEFKAGSLGAGTYTFELRVQDSSGAWSNVTRKNIVVQNNKPMPVIVYTPVKSSYTSLEYIDFHANNSYDPDGDSITAVEWYRIKDGSRTKLSWGINGGSFRGRNVSGSGYYTFELRVRDSQGEWSFYASVTIHIENTQPVASLYSYGVNTSVRSSEISTQYFVSPNGQVEFYTSTTDNDGDRITEAEWYYTKDGVRTKMAWGVNGGRLNVSDLSQNGTNRMELRVKDATGLWSNWEFKDYIVNEQPVTQVHFQYGPWPLIVTTTGTHDPDGYITQIETRREVRRSNGTIITDYVNWHIGTNYVYIHPNYYHDDNTTFYFRVKDNKGEWSYYHVQGYILLP